MSNGGQGKAILNAVPRVDAIEANTTMMAIPFSFNLSLFSRKLPARVPTIPETEPEQAVIKEGSLV